MLGVNLPLFGIGLSLIFDADVQCLYEISPGVVSSYAGVAFVIPSFRLYDNFVVVLRRSRFPGDT